MDDWPSTITRSNQVATREHISPYKLSGGSWIRASACTRQGSLTNLQNGIKMHALSTLNNLKDGTMRSKVMHKTTNILTTRLPLSKVIVYLRVQKSRAGASVVGAYVCSKFEGYSLTGMNKLTRDVKFYIWSSPVCKQAQWFLHFQQKTLWKLLGSDTHETKTNDL